LKEKNDHAVLRRNSASREEQSNKNNQTGVMVENSCKNVAISIAILALDGSIQYLLMFRI